MADGYQITPDSLEILLGYDRLTARSLGDFLSSLADLAALSVEMYGKTFVVNTKMLPTLEIEAAHTGDSIKLKFGEGWMPSVTTDEKHDIIIDVPKKLGIPLLIGYLLLSGASQALDIRNEYLDGRIKELELILKESEVEKARQENKKMNRMLENRATEVFNMILENTDFKEFRVYDTDILRIQNDSDNRDRQDIDEEN